MLHNVSLNASMRANLLSLQQTSKLQDITSNRLSTGLKVNSAIDNPSAYYTAQSLSDRASDLNSLLDAMSQGIQTLKAVAETIDAAAGFLQQAKAVASQALETVSVPSKEWFIEKVGPDGAVVETADELKAAVDAGKETIVVYGQINLNDDTRLKENQKLVGTDYYTRNFSSPAGQHRFSQLNIISDGNNGGIITSGNNLISDLTVSYKNYKNIIGGTVTIEGRNNILQNVDLSMWGTTDGGSVRGALLNNGEVTLHRKISLTSMEGNNVNGIGAYQGKTTIAADANVKIKVNNDYSHGIINYTNSVLDIYGKLSCEIYSSYYAAIANNNPPSYAGNTVNIHSSAELYVKNSKNSLITNNSQNILTISAGAKLGIDDNYFISGNFFDDNTSSSATDISLNFIQASPGIFSSTGAFIISETNKTPTAATAQLTENYNRILSQYDMLISDGSYKGVNLLKNDSLKVSFNEDRSSYLNIAGVDASSRALGICAAKWDNLGAVSQSLAEISSALNQLRNYSAQFGTYNNVLTTRQNFTEAMINVLEEGADKLTLADMNQESANMLALQTRQMLAVNSLSLASQASQSVLKLF